MGWLKNKASPAWWVNLPRGSCATAQCDAKDGESTSGVHTFRAAPRFVSRPFKGAQAIDFSPLILELGSHVPGI